MTDDPDFLNRIEDDEEDLYRSYVRPVHPLAAKAFFWLAVAGGTAVGVCLFLFFLAFFIYFFLPITLLFIGWVSYKKWCFNREWRKIKDRF